MDEQRLFKIENDIVDLKTRLAVAESNIKDMREDITLIKSNTTWILRVLVGTIITSVIGLLITNGGV